MNKTLTFKVADHCFTLSLDERYASSPLLGRYMPFNVSCDNASDILFSVQLLDSMSYEITQTLFEDSPATDDGVVKVNVYETTEGLLYKIFMPSSTTPDALLHVVGERSSVVMNAESALFNQISAFNNAMILSFVTFTLPHNTLLLHASAVLRGGKAYLFIAKSGTGKSTHTSMWIKAFDDAELLNDDHPVVRVHASGEVLAYGSPWSGKTPCYRNLSAPLVAVSRIIRANHNKLTKLSILASYASLMTSSTSMQWSKSLSAAKVKALETLITNVKCYNLECLPNTEAAECCYAGIWGKR